MHNFFQMFVKITGWLPQLICFRTRIRCEDKTAQTRFIHGPAIIVSNHTSVYDFAAMLFVFPTRVLRYQMAEVLFQKKGLGRFLRWMGGIYLNRYNHQYDYMETSLEVLRKGGVVGIFPEGRLPREGETPPLEFQPGAAFLSLTSGVKIIPVWVNGSYFRRKRACAVIGTPLFPEDYADPLLTEKERITAYTRALREKIIRLKELSHE